MSDAIRISHNAEDGTLATGDTKPHRETIKRYRFAWSSRIGESGAWYIRNSRDRAPDMQRIGDLTRALEAVGVTVELSIDQEQRSTVEREHAKAERLEGRADALDAKAERLGGQADATLGRAPWFSSSWERGIAVHREAEEAARRAEASRRTQRQRESGPTTMRRIEKLEAEERDITRKLTPCRSSGKRAKPTAEGRTIGCPFCYRDITITGGQVPEHGGPSDEWREQLTARAAVVADDLAYWRNHLAELRASGAFTQYGPDSIEKGDAVQCRGSWYRVKKVNAKTVTVPSGYSWDDRISYDEIKGIRKAADLVAAAGVEGGV